VIALAHQNQVIGKVKQMTSREYKAIETFIKRQTSARRNSYIHKSNTQVAQRGSATKIQLKF
jgi:hypothetical protein